MNLIKHRFIFLGISGALVLLSWLSVAFFGLKQGIDLKGGAEWQIILPNENQIPLSEKEKEIKTSILEINPEANPIIKTSENLVIIRLPNTNEETHNAYKDVLNKKFSGIKEISFSSIGPTIGNELKKQAIKASIATLVAISLYIAWAFRKVSKPVQSWKYGVTTMLTLFHDVSIPIGLLALLGWWKNIEIDINFIVALLVIMGFSVHDTIVVFDRIRENLITKSKNHSFAEIINSSVKETLARSVNTSLTLVLVLFTLLFWGPGSLFYFILAILIGTLFGTYSSIFVASPIIYIWNKNKQ